MRSIAKKLSMIAVMVCMIVAFMPMLGQGHAHAASIKLSNTKVYLVKGDSFKLTVKGTKAKVKWKSSNKKIATVSKGKIKAKKNGKCTITAKVKGKTLKCKVTVQKATKNAAALRNYILKKGKKIGGEYGLTKKIPTEEGYKDVALYAKKSGKAMTFYWYHNVGTPAEGLIICVDINLISGGKIKKGDFYRYWEDGYGELPWYKEWKGTLTTKFNGKNSGLTLKEVVETEVSRDDEDNEVVNTTPVTDPDQLANELSGSYSMTKGAFKEMKQLVLKSGTTFKSIGFSKL